MKCHVSMTFAASKIEAIMVVQGCHIAYLDTRPSHMVQRKTVPTVLGWSSVSPSPVVLPKCNPRINPNMPFGPTSWIDIDANVQLWLSLVGYHEPVLILWSSHIVGEYMLVAKDTAWRGDMSMLILSERSTPGFEAIETTC